MGEPLHQERLPGIQLGRAIAAIAVFYFHGHIALGYFDAWRLDTWQFLAERGAAGVDLFFAISGFIVCYIAARPGFTPYGFLLKRFFRIYPLNALVTLVMIALFALSIGGPPQEIELQRVLRSLLIIPQQAPMNAVGWTLEYEVAFYLVSAILIPLGGARLLLAWCIGAAWLGSTIDPQPPLVARFLDGHYADFAAGIVAYLVAIRMTGMNPATRWGVSGGLLASAAAVYLVGLRLPLAWLTPVACCLAAIGFASIPSVPRFTERLGDISYGLYLWHWPLAMFSPWLALWVRAGKGNGELWRWCLLALICLIAWASWRYLEQPINRWAARLARSKPRVDERRAGGALVEHGELAGRQGGG